MNPIRPPSMVRSRSQLGGPYAPHHPFTFEGGEGACITTPWSGNRDAALKAITSSLSDSGFRPVGGATPKPHPPMWLFAGGRQFRSMHRHGGRSGLLTV
jgi:hypothetical protein